MSKSDIREFDESTTDGSHVAIHKTFIVDGEDDLVDLPAVPKVSWGSFAICLESGDIYTLRKSGNWEKFR